MATLKSKLFTEDPESVAAALENCANGFPSQVQSHFSTTDNRSGPQITRLQIALQTIQAREPDLKIPFFSINGTYDGAFAEAVKTYKAARNITNFAGQIDNVIGVKTIQQLDSEINDAPPPPEPPDVDPVAKLKADIVVRLKGFNDQSPLKADEVLPAFLAPGFAPKPGQPDTVMFNPISNRVLIRLGSTTNTIDGASLLLFSQFHFDMRRLSILSNATIDRVYILGSSSGGRNAVNFAAFLTRKGISPSFLVAIDGHYTQADTPMRPLSETDPPAAPEFQVDAGATPSQNRFNFFQIRGNHVGKPKFGGALFFTSSLDGEIHGKLVGFNNQSLDSEMPNNPNIPVTDMTLHVIACDIGTDRGQRLIGQDLRNAKAP